MDWLVAYILASVRCTSSRTASITKNAFKMFKFSNLLPEKCQTFKVARMGS